jgi:hypothetical protein
MPPAYNPYELKFMALGKKPRWILNERCKIVFASTLLAFSALGSSASPKILSTRVESYRVENVTMEGALRALRATNYNEVLIGFEKISRGDKEEENTMSLSIANTTVGEILDALTMQDSRYKYETVDDLMVDVHPLGKQQDDPLGLLNLRIKEFSVEGNLLPAAVIERIGELAPELASYLDAKQNEFYRRRGVSTSVPGSMLHGNMDPHIELHLRDCTVREILNSIVLYSLRLNNRTAPDWTGYKIPPTSWMYEFVVDSAEPTGLGGYPRWVAF